MITREKLILNFSFRIWPLNDLGTQNENLYHDPQGKLIPPPYKSLWIWPLDDRWLQNIDLHHDPQVKLIPSPKFENLTSGWPLTPKLWSPSWLPWKTDLTTKVWEFDLWMTFDPNVVNSIMIPRENWSHHQSFRPWPVVDLWPKNSDTHDPQGHLIPPPKVEVGEIPHL